MELYYNPERMDEAEVRSAFVAREPLLDELTSLLTTLAATASNEHFLLVGERGMGKTTMLLMLRLAVRGGALGQTWFPVRFPEEPYAINALNDFWTETALNLAHASGDPVLAARLDSLRQESADSATYADCAAEAIRDWCRRNRRRLLLLIDNLDQLLLQIHAPADRARLAGMLSRDGAFTVAASAAAGCRVLREFSAALKQPLRSWPLAPLDHSQSEELLRRRAAVEGHADFEERLKLNRSRLNVLRHFTAGNPRHTLMLYRIFANSDAIEVRRGLDWLLDEITPYFQARTDALPPQQRKILDSLARVGGRTGEGLTPTRIARETALPVNQVSVQLKRLSDLGYVRAAHLSGRNAYYSAAEPLFAIWRQSRFGREGRHRVEWMIEFLKRWYANRESGEQAELLGDRLRELLSRDKPDLQKPLDYKRYLVGAMDRAFRGSSLDRPVQAQILHALFLSRNWKEAAGILESVKEHTQGAPRLWALRAMARTKLGRKQEALQDYDRYLALTPHDEVALERAEVLIDLRQHHRAIESCDAVLRRSPQNLDAQALRALLLAMTGRFEEAIECARPVAVERPAAAVFLQAVLRLREIAKQPASLLRYLLGTGAFDEARVVWRQLLASENNRTALAALAAQAMSPANLEFLTAMVPDEPSDDAFLYLRRALECASGATGAAALAKLSADIRPVVQEILQHCQRSREGAEPVEACGLPDSFACQPELHRAV